LNILISFECQIRLILAHCELFEDVWVLNIVGQRINENVVALRGVSHFGVASGVIISNPILLLCSQAVQIELIAFHLRLLSLPFKHEDVIW
jgi:hypothetical protein